jgi:hypothetical protein
VERCLQIKHRRRRFTPPAASRAIDNYQFTDMANKSEKATANKRLADGKSGTLGRQLAVPV